MRGADGSGQAKDRSSRYTIDRQPALADAQTVLEQSLSFSGSSEDTALLDEVVAIAHEERRRPANPPDVLSPTMVKAILDTGILSEYLRWNDWTAADHAAAASGTQFIPHIPGLQRPPLGHMGASADLPAPECAANVDSSCRRCFSPQDGQLSSGTPELWRTSFSNFVPQSSHRYS
jgi:hypothetical protein